MAVAHTEARKRAHWLLDLTVGGTVYRFSDLPLTVDDDRGATWTYQEGLPDLAPPLTRDGAAEITIGLELQSTVDWALLESRGLPIDRSPVVLRRWWEGTTLERSRVYLRGLALGISYGKAGEPLSVTLTQDPRLESDVIPDAQAVVDEETWSGRTDRSEGHPYPIPIGYPGATAATVVVPRPGVPAPLINWISAADPTNKLLLCLGRCHAQTSGVSAAGVWIWNRTKGWGLNGANIGTTTDALGRLVTYVEFSGARTDMDSEDEYWVGYDVDYGGGILNPWDSTVPLRGAGDVIAWALLFHSSIRTDRGRLWSLRPWLNQFQVDTYINGPVNVWDWITSTFLRWLPVQVRQSNEGLYFLPVRWDYTAQDVEATLDAGAATIDRVSSLARLVQPIYNEVTVRYRPASGGGSKWGAAYTITSTDGELTDVDADATADTRVRGSYVARRSQHRFGVRRTRVDLPHIHDPATAERIAQLMLARHAWPKRTVRYHAPREYEVLEPGIAVSVTDSDIHLSSALAYLVDLVPTAHGVHLDLVLLDQPAHESHTT